MNILQKAAVVSALLASFGIPAFAGVTIASPTANESVGTSLPLSANASACSSQQVGSMGYSLDSSSQTTVVNGNSISRTISVPAGTHTIHVKAWGLQGAACVADVTISAGSTVSANSAVAAASTGGPSLPATAVKVSALQALSSWTGNHDAGTPGTSTGTMSMSGSPSRSGNARKFFTTFKDYGGELYKARFADDTAAMHFLYDGWVFLQNTTNTVANIEMDLNQVMSNGLTVIFGFQCDGWSGTWDYTANLGTPTKPVDNWIHSAAKCNPANWSQNVWHHVQVSYYRDNSGNVTYQSVWLDGTQQVINKTVNSAFALGWSPTLLTNFQVDGKLSGSGSSTVYLDQLAIFRW